MCIYICIYIHTTICTTYVSYDTNNMHRVYGGAAHGSNKFQRDVLLTWERQSQTHELRAMSQNHPEMEGNHGWFFMFKGDKLYIN